MERFSAHDLIVSSLGGLSRCTTQEDLVKRGVSPMMLEASSTDCKETRAIATDLEDAYKVSLNSLTVRIMERQLPLINLILSVSFFQKRVTLKCGR